MARGPHGTSEHKTRVALCDAASARVERGHAVSALVIQTAVRWVRFEQEHGPVKEMEVQSSERFRRCEEGPHLSFSYATARVSSDYPCVEVTLIDGRLGVEEHEDLVFTFEQALAVTVHEEFAHPYMPTVHGIEPLIGNGKRSTYPVLVVEDSPMFVRARAEYELRDASCTHYRFCTAFPVIDILASARPRVQVVKRIPESQDLKLPSWVPQ